MSGLTKDGLRRELINKRESLTDEEINDRNALIAESLIRVCEGAESIFTYISGEYEADTKRTIESLLKEGRAVAVPLVFKDEGAIRFYRIMDFENLRQGSFGIYEPVIGESEPEIFPDEGSVIIVPGAVFDKGGYRIGYGGGYYDKYLSDKQNIMKIGVCFDFQVIGSVPRDGFDVPVDMVVTDKRIYHINDLPVRKSPRLK